MILIKEFDKYVKIDKECLVEDGKFKSLRQFILKRDNFTCQYCGARHKPLEVDHIKPRAKGGLDTEENLITACITCNRSKGSKCLSEWMPDIFYL